MARKYIKDKQGRFQGSVPDKKAIPTPVSQLPQKMAQPASETSSQNSPRAWDVDAIKSFYESREKAHEAERQEGVRGLPANPSYLQGLENYPDDIRLKHHEEDYYGRYEAKSVKGYAGEYILEDDESKFRAHVGPESQMATEECGETAFFATEEEASEWCQARLSERTRKLRKFKDIQDNNPEELQATLDKTLEAHGKVALLYEDGMQAMQRPGGVSLNGATIEIDSTASPFTNTVTVSRERNGRVEVDSYQSNDATKCATFGIFVALHD
jgi:hypothetical protein